MENALEIKNLQKRFDCFTLDGVSFNLPKGFIMGFVGKNGAGKTTTIKLIMNMLKRNDGEILVLGKDNMKHEIENKSKIGVVMDSPFYVNDWTLTDVGKALKPFYANWSDSSYENYLADFSLDQKKKVGELSRGMKMKLMIACALSHNAQLLILDEPTSGLDAVVRNELLGILTNFIADKNNSILFSTHISADLERIADYITFINNGKIIMTDTKDNLLEKYVLVKGELGTLTQSQKNLIIGYQESKVNFDGIIEKSKTKELPKGILIEPCNLDELVVRFNIGGAK